MRGHGEQAAEVLVGSVRLLRTIRSSFSRYLASTRVLGSLRILLRHNSLPERVLVRLQRTFEGLPDSDTLAQEMIESRAQFLDTIARPGRTIGETLAGRILRPWSTIDWRQQLRIFDDAIAFARGPLPERFDRAAAFEQNIVAGMKASQRRTLFTAWLVPRRTGGFAGMSLPSAAYRPCGQADCDRDPGG